MSVGAVLSGQQRWHVECADALAALRQLPDGCVQCCITSPPYYGLRDYGTGQWEGGEEGCEHKVRQNAALASSTLSGGKATTGHQHEGFKDVCGRCGARRIDQQIGLEDTPGAYVRRLVEVMEEVRRVLRDDGVLFINLGDSYCGSGAGGGGNRKGNERGQHDAMREAGRPKAQDGLKPKDLCGIPWRVAFALQEAGWWLRSDMPWVKRAAMPESVTDRPAKALEYVFMLAKSERYFFDMEAVRKPLVEGTHPSCNDFKRPARRSGNLAEGGNNGWEPSAAGRNFRNADLWFASIEEPHGVVGVGDEWVGLDVNTEPWKGSHFATFPRALVEPCLLAGTSVKGCCPACGAPWERVVERTAELDQNRSQANRAMELAREHGLTDEHLAAIRAVGVSDAGKAMQVQSGSGKNSKRVQELAAEAKKALGGYFREFLLGKPHTLGWQPTCDCPEAEPIGCLCLDPFCGSGAAGAVAIAHGRRFVGIDLNPKYVAMAERRIGRETPCLPGLL